MDSSKDLLPESLLEPESDMGSIYEPEPNIKSNELRLKQRAATFSSPSELPLSLPSASEHFKRKEKKRRSKYDLTGRDHQCEYCNKSYLSYPALYTHTKTKHAEEPIPSRSTTGKARRASETLRRSSFSECFEFPEQKGTTQDVLKILLNVIEEFNKDLKLNITTPESHPLVKAMKKEDRSNCDGVLTEYCMSVGKIVNEDYFNKICRVVIGYRECLNKYGWTKFSENNKEESKFENSANESPIIETILEYTQEYQKIIRQEYTSINDATYLPEVSNEFILLFARQHHLGVEEGEMIRIVMNMCSWMYKNKYTKTRVTLIN
jgi:hypothetical protein